MFFVTIYGFFEIPNSKHQRSKALGQKKEREKRKEDKGNHG
jgi:hypothetical protein